MSFAAAVVPASEGDIMITWDSGAISFTSLVDAPEFKQCEFCARHPERGQKETVCLGCGAPLKKT